MEGTYISIIRPDAKLVVNWTPFDGFYFFFEVNSNCSLHVFNAEYQHALTLKINDEQVFFRDFNFQEKLLPEQSKDNDW